nr:response regulator [Nitrospirota bacterium]
MSASSVVERASLSQAQARAGDVMGAIEALLLERRGDLLMLAGLPTVKGLDPAAVSPALDYFVVAKKPAYRLALLADAQGQILAVNQVDGEGRPISSAPLLGRTVAQEPWFQATLRAVKPVVVEELSADPLTEAVFGAGASLLGMSVPIKDDLGTVTGVLSVRLAGEPLRETLARSSQLGSSEGTISLLLLNKENRPIAGPAQLLSPERPPFVTVPAAGFVAASGLRWRLAVYAVETQPGLPEPRLSLLALGMSVLLAGGGVAWAVGRRGAAGPVESEPPRDHGVGDRAPQSGPAAVQPASPAEPAPRESQEPLDSAHAADRKQRERWLEKINQCFLGFGKDPDENIAHLTALAGELLGATCSLYSRLDEGLLCAVGQWQTPPGFKPVDKPEGHICHDVITKSGKQLLVVRNLPQTPYAATDPNVLPYKLQTYLGMAVSCGGRSVGALCTVFQSDVVPNEEDEKLMGIIASAIGIEEDRKRGEVALTQSEEQVRQLQRMEAVGRFAGDVAHDFNNLLTIILGHSEILLEDLDPQAPSFHAADEISKAAGQASALTQHLLTFSRKQPRQLERLNLNDLITAQIPALGQVLGNRSRLATSLAPDLGLILADTSQIDQVLLNLCLNARDAMPDGGTVTIETRNETVDEAFVQRHIQSKPGAYVMLLVTDQGVGMDDYVQAHCFEPFFTTKPKEEATGLGLSTVYGIVKQSGGFVEVVSAPGQGATFKVYLPCVEAPASATAPPPGSQKLPRGTETLLLVEDEVGLRMLLWRVLEQQGYTVLDASSGSAALGLASSHQGPIHLLVTDVVMPEMNGAELARLLSPVRPEMKVLFISGYPDETVEGHGVVDPQTTMLPKPFTPERLARKVREVLDRPA